jgi:hypothetical protein
MTVDVRSTEDHIPFFCVPSIFQIIDVVGEVNLPKSQKTQDVESSLPLGTIAQRMVIPKGSCL